MKALLTGTILATTALCTPAAMAQDTAQSGATSAPAPSSAPESDSRPNVLIWMMDDVGFAQVAGFGGIVDTPNIARVVAMGLRYSNYHTPPICSATRAALLSGRNAHSVNVGSHAGASIPFPGYSGIAPRDAGTIAANMKAAGYATFALGKWDHFPTPEMTQGGPFTHWPSGQGFDRFYGFLAAETDQFHPGLVRDNSPVRTPERPGYHLSADLADEAVSMIGGLSAAPGRRPFLMYWASGIAHAPHHAPADWIARYKGRFDQGWDRLRETTLARQIAAGLVPKGTKLAPRPEGMPAWSSLSADQKRLYTRQMEVFAASLSYTDAQFGRILDSLEKSGELANTIVLITADNGASAEGAHHGTYNENLFANAKHPDVAENLPFLDKWGSDATFPHYSFGWAVAGNTPFRYYKQTTHEGGTHVAMVLAWPKGIAARGQVRGQFVHVSDIAPTVMELAGVPLSPTINNVAQRPMEGLSFAYTLSDPKAADRKQVQYFEMFGNKGLWAGGWSAATSHRLRSWDMNYTTPFTEPWELYDLTRDPGQTTDLAAKYPARVAEMDRLFNEQAKAFNVLPLHNMGESVPYQTGVMRAQFAQRRGKWSYPGPVYGTSEGAGPPIQNLPFVASMELELPTGAETGPVFVVGGKLGGMGLVLHQGVPSFVLRGMDGSTERISADRPLPKGASKLEVILDRQPAKPLTEQDVTVTIRAGGTTLASRTLRTAIPARYGISHTFDIGIDFGSTLVDDYAQGVPFPGTIGAVVFDFNSR